MTMIQVAMLGKLPCTAMPDAIFTHPLLAEGLSTLFVMFGAKRLRVISRWGNQTSGRARSPVVEHFRTEG
jgi:hypothetical protein